MPRSLPFVRPVEDSMDSLTTRALAPEDRSWKMTQFLQIDGCLCHLTPASRALRNRVQQGPFAPRELPRFITTTDPAATVSSSIDFPGSPVIRPTLLRRFRGGTWTASPVARHVLVTVLPLPPRRSDAPHRSDFDVSCSLRPIGEGSAFGV